MRLSAVNFLGSEVLADGREISKNTSSVSRRRVEEKSNRAAFGEIGAIPRPVGGKVSEIQILPGRIFLFIITFGLLKNVSYLVKFGNRILPRSE